MKSVRDLSILQASWGECLSALRVNILPGILLQIVMAGMAAAYVWNPTARHGFQQLADLRSQWGLLFSFLGTSVASAVFPELLRLALPKGWTGVTDGHGILSRFLFAIPFWGLIGMQVDLFYRLQYFLFGPSDSVSVIVKKVLVDSLIYCPTLAVPQVVCIFLWRDHGFTFRGFHGHAPGRFYALKILPVLITNWTVWIPLICIIYSLPAPLGVPFFIIAQCFWVMVFTTISSARHHHPAPKA
jgi:hypothetical protein